MTLRLFVQAFCVWITLGSGSSAFAADAAAIDAKLELAAGILFNEKSGETGIQKGFALLVEAIALIVPQTGFPAEFGNKLADARKALESGSFLDPGGTALLKEAYLLVNSGQEFRVPAGIASLEEASEHGRRQVAKARTHLKEGKFDECAKAVLEVALMIVTPIQPQGPGGAD